MNGSNLSRRDAGLPAKLEMQDQAIAAVSMSSYELPGDEPNSYNCPTSESSHPTKNRTPATIPTICNSHRERATALGTYICRYELSCSTAWSKLLTAATNSSTSFRSTPRFCRFSNAL